jgi:hypothetical protein
MENDFKNIVSTDWLEEHLEAPDIRIIDSSWYFPHEKRNAEQEFMESHIPGACFFDIDKIKDAPGIWLSINSCSAFRFSCGKYQLESIILISGASKCSSNQSVETIFLKSFSIKTSIN